MPVCHTRPGKAHNVFNLLSHIRLIAVYSAVSAGCLPFLEGTFIKAFLRIFKESTTFRAKDILCFVLMMTIDSYHLLNGLLFTPYSAHPYPLSLYYSEIF